MDKLDRLPLIFSASEAAGVGITPYELLSAVREERLYKLHRGVYRKASSPDEGQWESLLAATKRIPHKCAVCLVSALAYHGLTDTIPEQVWLMVDKTSRTKQSGIRLLRLVNPHWDIGMINEDGLAVTSVERTFVDLILYIGKVGPTETYIPLKEALQQKVTDAYRILQVAKSLGMEHRVRKSLEVLLYER